MTARGYVRSEKHKATDRERSHAAALRRRYDITPEEYEMLLHAQGGVCAICRRPETTPRAGGKIGRLTVDHDHATKKVRGLLCLLCNVALAAVEKGPMWIAAAQHYLETSETCYRSTE